MYIELLRKGTIKKNGVAVQTIGNLYVFDEDKGVVADFATIELPWNDNAPFISCIPPKQGGHKTYKMELLESSNAFNYEHYWIKDVPNRKYIKIHRGNYYDQIEGCILIGEKHTDINNDGVVDVTNSTESLVKLVALLGKEAEITIRNLP